MQQSIMLWVSVPLLNSVVNLCSFLTLGSTEIGWRCWEGGCEWSDETDGNVERLSGSIAGTWKVRRSNFFYTCHTVVMRVLCIYQLLILYYNFVKCFYLMNAISINWCAGHLWRTCSWSIQRKHLWEGWDLYSPHYKRAVEPSIYHYPHGWTFTCHLFKTQKGADYG